MNFLERWLTYHGYARQKTWLAYTLFPASWVFCACARGRRWLYQKKWLKTYRAPCPVIVVGNITVGGVGKTPLIVALYFLLQARGWAPGIVSRGYRGQYKNSVCVTPGSCPQEVGDEAVMLATRTGAPVVVCRDRTRAVKTLLQQFACDIVLSDDGLQHYALERDIEIAVYHAQRHYGNGWCLPAGPLREPLSRLRTVDIIAVHGGEETQCAFSLQGETLVNLINPEITQTLSALRGQRVHAVAGIGFPQPFFDFLDSFQLEVIPHSYPDHYAFCAHDFCGFTTQDIVIMTEKDAVKCRSFVKHNSWFLRVDTVLNSRLTHAFTVSLSKITR